jgi:hypothetical protein
MNNWLMRLARTKLSLADVWRCCKEPWRIDVGLTSPKDAISTIDAAAALLNSVSASQLEDFRKTLIHNDVFWNTLNNTQARQRHSRTISEDWRVMVYLLVRAVKPDTIVETGVFDGASSALILQALYDNGSGRLISIDIPATERIDMSIAGPLPSGCQPGWLIPDYLKDRHSLCLGDSKTWLPRILGTHSRIDIFLHDSLHTREHQLWEYSTVWPHIKEGGFLLSDDIYASPAFHRFCRSQSKSYVCFRGFGGVRK